MYIDLYDMAFNGLAAALQLSPERRFQIAEEIYAEAKMFADTVPLTRKAVLRLMRRTPRDVGRWVHAAKDSCVMAAVARGQLPGPEKNTHRVVAQYR